MKWHKNPYWNKTNGPDYSHPKYTAQTPTHIYKIFLCMDSIELFYYQRNPPFTRIFQVPFQDEEYLLVNFDNIIMQEFL